MHTLNQKGYIYLGGLAMGQGLNYSRSLCNLCQAVQMTKGGSPGSYTISKKEERAWERGF